MAGPARSVKGGISSVVNQYYGAGLDSQCELRYVATVEAENALGKALDAARGYRTFRRLLPWCEVVHLHASVRGSFKRKRALARLARDAGKSPDVLLHAARAVLGDHPDVRFRFGGDGDVDKYRSLADELGIAGSCDFLGWVGGDDKERLFAQSGIYCLPSRNEGIPMSVLEAMAHGLAAVATPVGGTPQIISDGTNGCLVPVGDDRRLAEVLCMLLDDADLRARMGRAGWQTVNERFNARKMVDGLVCLYEKL